MSKRELVRERVKFRALRLRFQLTQSLYQVKFRNLEFLRKIS